MQRKFVNNGCEKDNEKRMQYDEKNEKKMKKWWKKWWKRKDAKRWWNDAIKHVIEWQNERKSIV